MMTMGSMRMIAAFEAALAGDSYECLTANEMRWWLHGFAARCAAVLP
jgi:hypothetical protein